MRNAGNAPEVSRALAPLKSAATGLLFWVRPLSPVPFSTHPGGNEGTSEKAIDL